ncbi:MAG: transcriptional repressor NrdR [Clostridia bacterium]|nr:transcriptional repressor NrdR [Clostridia bacterium]
MKCPFCGYVESKVIDSRPTDENSRIRRRRECLQCAKRFTTYEVVESMPIIVVKRDNSREVFDRQKLFNGLLRACEKRPVSLDVLEKAVDEIETRIQNSLDREITAATIGEYAMEALKDIDAVAYVRFASVYRQFTDVGSFQEMIEKLLGSSPSAADKT